MVRGFVFMATLVAVAAAGIDAHAADAGRGASLAQDRCASCHIVTPHARKEVADSPPFETIARKYGYNETAILHAIVGPHPKMNFAPDPEEAADIAAYIATLGP
jgi:mono/diheme cytochrome c family protein